MNLNLSSVFSLPALNAASSSESKSIQSDKYIRIILFLAIVILAIFNDSLVEYAVVLSASLMMKYSYSYYKDLTSIDLHFSNDDMELNEIINDLWN